MERETNLLGLAQAVHENTTGSSDSLGKDEFLEHIRILLLAVEDWKENSIAKYRPYDNLVLGLIKQALSDAEAEAWQLEPK